MTDTANLGKPPSGGKLRLWKWETLGMSRASWYRHGKPDTKPKRNTQADIAKACGCSVRTIQRDLAEVRKKNREPVVARARELIAQGHDQEHAIEIAISEYRQMAESRDDPRAAASPQQEE